MTLEEAFTIALEKSAEHNQQSILSEEALFHVVDLTLLRHDASTDELNQLVAHAIKRQVAAICLFPQHLRLIPQIAGIKRATVVNFPGGDLSIEDILTQINDAITLYDADEIDYVFPYATYLSGQKKAALNTTYHAYHLCKQYNKTFKVILETGALPSIEIIYQLSKDVIHHGCDFLKTSTGKIPTGATLPAAYAMLAAIRDTNACCGIKISGGVKTMLDATRFIYLAEYMSHKVIHKNWFRIGTSGLCC